MIVVGFAGLVSDWWENLPANARNGMLFADDGDQQILKALGKKFHGEDEMDERDHYASLFMTARLCNLAQVEEYFCYMQKLLIRAGKANDPAYLKHYLCSFPGHIPDAVEKYIKDKNIPLQTLSLTQLHFHIKET